MSGSFLAIPLAIPTIKDQPKRKHTYDPAKPVNSILAVEFETVRGMCDFVAAYNDLPYSLEECSGVFLTCIDETREEHNPSALVKIGTHKRITSDVFYEVLDRANQAVEVCGFGRVNSL